MIRRDSRESPVDKSGAAVIAVGGTWMVPADALAKRDWVEITKRVTRALELVEQ